MSAGIVTKRIYLAEKNGKRFLYLEDFLKSNGIDTDEKIVQAIPSGGRWCNVLLKEPFTMADDARVKKLATSKDPETGQLRYDPARHNGCLLRVAVEDWDLPWSHDEEGYAKMTPKNATIVMGLVESHCYDVSDHEELVLFLQQRSEAPNDSSKTDSSTDSTPES